MGLARGICVLIPLLLAIASTILGLLFTIPGGNKAVLEDLWFVQVNTSQVTVPNLPSEVSSLATSITKDLGVSEFYTSSLYQFCQGNYNSDGSLNFTNCSTPSLSYYFNPVTILEDDILKNLIQVPVPSELTDALSKIQTFSKGLFIGYIGGTASSAIGVFTGLFAFCSRWGSACTIIFGIIATILYIVAAAIATVMFQMVISAANSYTEQYGISSSMGTTALALSWAAAAVSLLSVLLWFMTCCCCTGRSKRVYESEDYTPFIEKGNAYSTLQTPYEIAPYEYPQRPVRSY
jgi:hypothetical protein